MVKHFAKSLSARSGLLDPAKFDKVMQKTNGNDLNCITLSKDRHVTANRCSKEARNPVHGPSMLDGRAAFKAVGLFNTVRTPVSGASRVLQQFHAQWALVHPGVDSQVQCFGVVVSPGYRLFPCRKPHQHPCGSGIKEQVRHDRGKAWPNAALPLSFHIGGSDPSEPVTKTQTGPRFRLPIRRPEDGRRPVTNHTGQRDDDPASRDCGADFGRVHPASQIRIQQAGQTHWKPCQGSYRSRPGQGVIRTVRVKKNGLNIGAAALQALKSCLEQLSHETLPARLFPRMPIIRFRPAQDTCGCGGRLKVQKTRQKTVMSMTTPFIAHETLLQCPECQRTFYAEDLRRLVPSRCNVAWDVLVFVGRSLFERHQTVEQIRQVLSKRNVSICPSEVEYLGHKFITYLAIAHRESTPKINQALQRNGGYILHLDATHEADAPALMTGLDSLSEFVLDNVKLPSERADHIIPFLRQLRSDYGQPVACVHDMGTGICKAVAEVFPDIRDFICHFHFLRDVGKDLIEPAYAQLRACLRKHSATTKLNALVRQVRDCLAGQCNTHQLASAIRNTEPLDDMTFFLLSSTYALALWCLQGKKSGDGYGFPFDRPLLEFAERLLILLDHLPGLIKRRFANNRIGDRMVNKLALQVVGIVKDPLFEPTVESLRWRCRLFDDLRKKMRIALPDEGNGLNDEGSEPFMDAIKKGILKFRRRLATNKRYTNDAQCIKVAEQIDQYGDKLFADPILLTRPTGSIAIYPQRTNNILEQFFRRLRRDYRRRTGNNKMQKTLQAMLADTPLVKNLSNPAYLAILLDGKQSLEERFAEIEINNGTIEVKPSADTDNVLPSFRSLVKLPDLPVLISELVAAGQALSFESN